MCEVAHMQSSKNRPIFVWGHSDPTRRRTILKRLIAMATAISLVAVTAAADAKKPPKPDLNQVVLTLQASLQKSGWWQVVPNGQNPNDESYVQFLVEALATLGDQGLNGRDLERLLCQAQGGKC